MLETIGTAVGVIAGLAGLLIAWRNARESAIRREDVLQWANEAITALEGLLLVCLLRETEIDPPARKSKLVQLMFDTAVLVERGRLFFRNVVIDAFGEQKQPAYRGYRPLILDPLVVAHQIARAWETATPEARLRMGVVAEDCLKTFVSLAQKEVGRSRTASADTAKSGSGAHLPHLLERVSPERAEKARLTAMVS